MSAPLQVDIEVEVRYAETDQMGIVHHSVYLVWFELARTRLCLESGYHYADIERLGHQLVVTRTSTRHVRGAHYGETVTVRCCLEQLSGRGLRFAYQVRLAERLLADGMTEHVWVRTETARPCRIPSVLVNPFRRLAGLAPVLPAPGPQSRPASAG